MNTNTGLHRYSRISLVLAILSFAAIGKSWADVDDFDRIFFFGDSLSDPGNIYAATGQASKAPYNLIPSAPYPIGGFQFSNGKTWSQRFAQSMQSNNSGKAALDAPTKNGNFAFGGARATHDPSDSERAPSSQDQLGLYYQNYGNADYPDALYVVQFGGNDIRDAIAAFFEAYTGAGNYDESFVGDFEGSMAVAAVITQSAAAANITLINQLHALGARHFLVATAADLGTTPAINFAPPPTPLIASMISEFYNGALQRGLESGAVPAEVSIDTLDLRGIVNEILANPEAYGIDNVESSCLSYMPGPTGQLIAYSRCSKPNKYLFWDGIHPTAKIHKIVSEAAESIYE